MNPTNPSHLTNPPGRPIRVAGMVLAAAVLLCATPCIRAQTAAPVPKFEAVSIRPCNSASHVTDDKSVSIVFAAGRLSMNCVTVHSLINYAYIQYANGQNEGIAAKKRYPIEGAPAWVGSDEYTVRAKADSDTPRLMIFGPMLQALLEDRFQLKTHRETREVSVLELTAGKNRAQLHPSVEDSCAPLDPGQPAPRKREPGQKPACGQASFRIQGPNRAAELRSMSMADFAHWIETGLDRHVIDKTGIAGKFDIDLEFAPASDLEPPDAGVPLNTALQQQLGLKLVSAKGPGEFLIVDRVERPSKN
jgi:uncharacterized protein (TIGR03435 family)